MSKSNTEKAGHRAADLRKRAARTRDVAGRFIRCAERAQPPASAVEPDPALAVATVFRATWKALNEVLDAEAPDELVAELDDAQGAAYDRLRTVRPTTPAGYRALADAWALALGAARGDEPGMMLSDQAADSLIAGAGACVPIEAASAMPHPDAALFALGAEFMAAWVAEEADGDEPEHQACSRIAEQIVRTPAATVAGYGIKALLLARLDSDGTGPHAPIAAHGPPDSWWNVLRQVQEGAARLAEAPDMGIPVTATAADCRLPPPDHDLSELSIEELARLYPVVVRTEEVMGSAENAPTFWTDCRTVRTPAGRVINLEADRLAQFASDIAKEMRRRQPVDDDESEERANTLLSHMVLTGGVAEHPDLIAEINATWGA